MVIVRRGRALLLEQGIALQEKMEENDHATWGRRRRQGGLSPAT